MDKYNLREIILNYPNQLFLGEEFAQNIRLPRKKYSNLIICGMGGSALPGDMLIAYLENNKKFDLPIYINRSYQLPKYTTKNSLVFISSYSGNTEETLACFKEAIKIGATIVAFASGGKIESIAKKESIPLVKYKIDYENFQPRYATTYAFVAMLHILTKTKNNDIILEYPEIKSSLEEKRGKLLAQEIKDKIPIIYASNRFKILAKNWKIKINENAKTPAFWNYFPELNHNEMVGFTNPQGNFIILILKTEIEELAITKRMKTTLKILKRNNLTTKIIEVKGKNYLESLLNGLVLGDWVSYYLAMGYNQDPTPVEMVETFKKELKK